MGEGTLFQDLMNYSATGANKGTVKKKKSEIMLEKIQKKGYDMSQLLDALKTRGNLLTVACAGSGKTTYLTFKVLYDLTTGASTRLVEVNGNNVRVPEKIWVCTFLNSGAAELRASVIKWQRELGMVDATSAIEFSTLHAEFKRALQSMSLNVLIISESENLSLLKKVIKSYGIVNEQNKPLNSQNYRDLTSALTYTRNRLDEKRYDKDIYTDLVMTPMLVDCVLRDWKNERRKMGVFDFEDLQEVLYDSCYKEKDQEVINFLANRYKYIYIDEFQDTSQIQYALLKVYGSTAKQVVAVGDDDQTIYSWRGSYNGIILKQFSEDFLPEKRELSINFRCPSNILNAIIPSIKLNEGRFDKSLRSAKEGGVIRYGGFSNYFKMVESLSNLVHQDLTEGLSVAIMCRVNSDGIMPALILDRLGGIDFSISGEGMTLDSYIGRSVMGICKLFTERGTSSVRQALSFLTWDTYCISNLLKVCKTNKKSFWNLSSEDISYSCPEIASILLEWRRWKESMGEVEALKGILQYYRTNVFCKDSQFNSVMNSVIIGVEFLISYFDYSTVAEFITELEDINDRLKARRGKDNRASVRIATVHEFKGKEADSVYVWNDSSGVFPYQQCNIDDDEELQEERRVHYIACTRAKKKSTVMYLKKKKGMFVKEMDLSNAENLIGNVSVDMGKGLKEQLEEDKNLLAFKKECLEDEKSNKENKDNVIEGLSEGYKTKKTSQYDSASWGQYFEDINAILDPEENQFWENDLQDQYRG